ncbi:Zn-ribbon domain-containing OB-fold protein [Saccharolobus solfataricus]|uniref:Nucleic acid-binding protein n=1 Tax=Saccharolobus solfataricus TaxID=2287 RepID=A0A157T766_SACSO|nr:Zn-ribbon domain-containing OB-fold protein [Saccharolobus solfataricus]SAI86751.1 nucleic acid-binding protein [Saccharolobus solfataricus]
MRLEEIYSYYDKIIRSGSLPYIRCRNCTYTFFYVRHVCPRCSSRDLEILRSNGIGKVFSWTKIFRKNESFIYGIVELEEGFKIYCNLASDVEIGDKVKVDIIPLEDGKYRVLANKL